MTEFPLFPDAYSIGSPIGKGDSFIVYMANRKSDNFPLSIKIMNLETSPISLEQIQKGTSFWSKCSHPNVVQYYGSFIDGPNVYVLQEMMSGGSLEDILKFGFGQGFKDEILIASIMSSVIQGLKYMHDNKDIQREIRASGIFISGSGEVKIGDPSFATSMILNGKLRAGASSLIGNASYMAPEMLQSSSGYTDKSDIWTVGLTSIHLATGEIPFANITVMGEVANLLEHGPPSLQGNFTQNFKQFVSNCLQINPEDRPSAEKLLQTKFIKSGKGKDYVFSYLVSKLSVLSERFQLLYGNVEPAPTKFLRVKQTVFNLQDRPSFPMIKRSNSATKTRMRSQTMNRLPRARSLHPDETLSLMSFVEMGSKSMKQYSLLFEGEGKTSEDDSEIAKKLVKTSSTADVESVVSAGKKHHKKKRHSVSSATLSNLISAIQSTPPIAETPIENKTESDTPREDNEVVEKKGRFTVRRVPHAPGEEPVSVPSTPSSIPKTKTPDGPLNEKIEKPKQVEVRPFAVEVRPSLSQGSKFVEAFEKKEKEDKILRLEKSVNELKQVVKKVEKENEEILNLISQLNEAFKSLSS